MMEASLCSVWPGNLKNRFRIGITAGEGEFGQSLRTRGLRPLIRDWHGGGPCRELEIGNCECARDVFWACVINIFERKSQSAWPIMSLYCFGTNNKESTCNPPLLPAIER